MRSSLNEKWLVCRICLKQPKDKMETIFSNDNEKDMTQMILECGGVPIQQFDHYPDKICDICVRQLRVAHKFRITCQRSHNQLSKFIAPVVVEKRDQVNVDSTVFELALDDEEIVDDTAELEVASIGLNATETEGEEEITFKLEAGDEEEVDVIKSEAVDELGEFVHVFEPMDEEVEEEFENIRSLSVVSEPVEYLDDYVDEVFTTDEEYLPETPSRKRKLADAQDVQKMNRKRQTLIEENKTKPIQNKKPPQKKRNKETSYICDQCGNIYPTQGRLTEHLKLHKGIKPHECEICGHAFAQTQQLTRHMNTHTGNRPYKCNYCPAAFADLSTRNKHHRIHTNERPYVCDVCGKAFTYTNTLKFHKMIHTGEKPFVCELCGKGFQQAYKLRNHKLTHKNKLHKVEKLEVETVTNNYQEIDAAASQMLDM